MPLHASNTESQNAHSRAFTIHACNGHTSKLMILKVLHVASADVWAGAEVQVFNQVNALHQRDDVEVSALLLNDGELARRLRAGNVPIEIAPEAQLSTMGLIGAIRACARNRGADIVHTHDYKETILACMALPGTTRVATAHGAMEPHGGLAGLRIRLWQHIERRCINHFGAGVICVSGDLAEQLRRWCRRPLRIIHNSVDIEHLDATPTIDLHKELGLSPQTPLIGIVGRLVPVKRAHVLLEALAQAEGWHGVIVGNGPLQNELILRARQLGLAQRTSFLGHRADAPGIVRALDALTLTSSHEGVPTALLEAMALRTPALVTPVGGIPEVVDDQTAVFIDGDDDATVAQSLATALRNLGRQPSDALERVAAARARLEAAFSASTQANRTADFYREIMTMEAPAY